MTAQMTAALHLVLDGNDKVAAGLKAMSKQLDGLRDAGKGLTLGALDKGLDAIRSGIRSAEQLKQGISSIGDRARSTGQAIRRMGEDLAFAAKYHGTLAAQGVGNYFRNARRPTLAGARENIGALGSAAAGYSIIEPVRKAGEIDNIVRHQAIYGGKTGAGIDTEVASLKRSDATLAIQAAQPYHEVAEAGLYLQQSQMKASTVKALLQLSAQAATAYNSKTLAVAKTAFSMHESLGISEKDIGQGLGIIGTAAKLQHFQFDDYAQLFPQTATLGAAKGVKGLQGATDLAAMLITSRAGAATPGEAATNLNDFITSLSHKNTHQKFADYGIDIEKLMFNAKSQGVNPLEAVLAKVQKLQKLHPEKDIIGHLFQNTQSQQFVNQFISHVNDYQEAKKHIKERASFTTLGEDFGKSIDGISAEVKRFDALTEILIARLGDGFAPALRVVSFGLYQVERGFQFLDEKLPGLGNIALSSVAGFVLLTAAFGILGTVAPVVAAGFTLMIPVFMALLAPLRLLWTVALYLVAGLGSLLGVSAAVAAAIVVVAVALVAAAIDIYRHWDKFAGFFQDIWDGIVDIFGGAWDVIAGIFTGDITRIIQGGERIWNGLVKFFSGFWGIIEQLFDDFIGWVDSWTGGAASAAIEKIKSAWGALKEWFAKLWQDIQAPFDAFLKRFENIHLFGEATPADPAQAQQKLDRQLSPDMNGLGGTPEDAATKAAREQQDYDRQNSPDMAGLVGAPTAKAHVTISTEPGLNATVRSSDPGVTVTTPTTPLDTGDTYRTD